MSYRSLQNDYLEEEFHRTIDNDSIIVRSNRTSLSSLSNNSDNNIMDSFSSNNSEIKCRICYETVDDPRQYCGCDGTVGIIHLECLKKWIVSNNYKLTCEICHEPYKIKVKWSYINLNNMCLILFLLICNVFFLLVYWFNYKNNTKDEDNPQFYVSIGIILSIVIIVWSLNYYKKKHTRQLVLEGTNYIVENLNQSIESIPIINTLTLTDSP